MTPVRAVAAVVLTAFTAFTAWVVGVYGLAGFLGWAVHNAATTQVFVDLCISLTLAMLAITADARARGKASWPYWVLALLTGSIGPLVYWVANPPRRRDRASSSRPPLAASRQSLAADQNRFV